MEDAKTLYTQADKLDADAKALREKAADLRKAELKAQPLFERLVYAAYARCDCGAGLAYDPAAEGDPSSVFMLERRGPKQWECGDILRYETLSPEKKALVKAATHCPPLPFAFYEVKSDKQPSANGASTRPKEGE